MKILPSKLLLNEVIDDYFFYFMTMSFFFLARNLSASRDVETDSVLSKGLGSTLARAADTLRVALLGEKADDISSTSGERRKFSAENFELLPSSDEHLAAASSENRQDSTERNKKFPAYQPASFRSWRMNIPSPLR